MNKIIYPYGQQTLDFQDINEVKKSLNSKFITDGEFVKKFEGKIKNVTNSKYSISCSSGTAALTLLYKSLDIEKNSNFLVPNITFTATASAAKDLGHNVFFCDVDPNTGLITPEKLKEKLKIIKEKIHVLVLVYLNGNLMDIDEISKICVKKNIKVVADGCHALGAFYKKQPIGGQNNILATTFSFHPVKSITTGEGGAITTNNESIAHKATLLRSHGIIRNELEFKNSEESYDEFGEKNPWYYDIVETGYNFRLTDFQCALGLSQLKKLKTFIKKRNKIARLYNQKFKKLTKIINPIKIDSFCYSSYHLYPVLINFSKLNITKAQLMNHLTKHGIKTQVHYIPLSKLSFWYSNEHFHGSFSYYKNVLSLPIYPGLELKDINYITNIIGNLISDVKKN